MPGSSHTGTALIERKVDSYMDQYIEKFIDGKLGQYICSVHTLLTD